MRLRRFRIGGFDEMDRNGIGCKFDTGSSNMSAENHLSTSDIVAFDCIQQQSMLGIDDPPPLIAGVLYEHTPVVLRTVPKSEHHRGKCLNLAAAVGEKMKPTIQRNELAHVDGRLQLPKYEVSLVEVICSETGDTLLQHQGLYVLTDLIDNIHLMKRQFRNLGAPVGLVNGKAFDLKHAQRFSHGQPARTQSLRDVLLSNEVTGFKMAVEDRLPQVVCNAFWACL